MRRRSGFGREGKYVWRGLGGETVVGVHGKSKIIIKMHKGEIQSQKAVY